MISFAARTIIGFRWRANEFGRGVDIVVRGLGTAVGDQEMAKGGGTRDEDWAESRSAMEQSR